MISFEYKIIYFILAILTPSLAFSQVDGFDYPFGNKGYDDEGKKIVILENIPSFEDYNIEFHENKNLPSREDYKDYKGNQRYGTPKGGWYNYNDVGHYYAPRNGIHPGEDWNLSGGDAGENVYAIANGVIKKVSTVISNSNKNGYCIVLEHDIPKNYILNKYKNIKFLENPEKIYSNYLHVTNIFNDDDFINGEKYVLKGEKIAEISSALDYPHLHFEITTQNNLCRYPNGNGGGYYSHNKKINSEIMGLDNTIAAMNYMKSDGFIDPSDFIEANRDLSDNPCKFSDLSTLNKSYDVVSSLCEKDIVSGFNNTNNINNIKINNKIDRSNWASFIYKTIKYMNYESVNHDCGNTPNIFNDINNNDWLCSFSKYLKENNIMNGYKQEFIKKQNLLIPEDRMQLSTCEIFEDNSNNVFCPYYKITYQEVAKTLFSGFLEVQPMDSYWKIPNNPLNSSNPIFQDINTIEAYIGCADKIGLFKNNDSFNILNMHNEFITRERAFISLNNIISKNIKSPITECNMDSK